jgi:hypothetical protein
MVSYRVKDVLFLLVPEFFAELRSLTITTFSYKNSQVFPLFCRHGKKERSVEVMNFRGYGFRVSFSYFKLLTVRLIVFSFVSLDFLA